MFGWTVHGADTDRPSFDDGTGHVSGSWEADQTPSTQAGLLPYISVERIDDTVRRVADHGGTVVDGPAPEGNLWAATFRDPSGNVLGIWHAGPR